MTPYLFLDWCGGSYILPSTKFDFALLSSFLILYYVKLLFCICCRTSYSRGSYKCFNRICCDVHEWFIILQRFESLDHWEVVTLPVCASIFCEKKKRWTVAIHLLVISKYTPDRSIANHKKHFERKIIDEVKR